MTDDINKKVCIFGFLPKYEIAEKQTKGVEAEYDEQGREEALLFCYCNTETEINDKKYCRKHKGEDFIHFSRVAELEKHIAEGKGEIKVEIAFKKASYRINKAKHARKQIEAVSRLYVGVMTFDFFFGCKIFLHKKLL